MSFYLRTSVKVGPFRCSLSQSGIGVSAGVPGLRVGSGPRGTYVRVGAAGVYAYATVPASRTTHPATGQAAAHLPTTFRPGAVVLEDVTGATTLEMRPCQPSELLQNVNEAAARHRLWPWVLLLFVVLSVAVSPLVLLMGAPAVGLVIWRDRVRRTIVAFYEVDGPQQVQYQRLVDQFRLVCGAQKAWHTVARGDLATTYQQKVNAGASSLVRREALARTFAGPPQLASNIAIPTLQSSARSIFLLPDRVLLEDRSVYAEVSYCDLGVLSDLERFIEDGHVPSDATVVDTTWKYVNKKGGPDRRFKNNRLLPVVQYSRVTLTDSAGMRTMLSFSDAKVGAVLAASVNAMQATSTVVMPPQRQPLYSPVPAPTQRLVPAVVPHPLSTSTVQAVRTSASGSNGGAEGRHQRADAPPSWAPRPLVAGAEFVPLSEDGRLAVVGESHYQNSLRAAVDGRVAGWDFDEHLPVGAVLVPEPTNPYDGNAVRVEVRSARGTATVGYLARDVAARYQSALLALGANRFGTCSARITGGGGKYYGIYLHVADPELMMFANQTESCRADQVSDLVTLCPEIQCTVTGEEHHQDHLQVYAPQSPNTATRVVVTLGYCEIVSGKYQGERAIEVCLDGKRVGQLTYAMTQRYAPHLDNTARKSQIPRAEAVVTSGSRGLQVELLMPTTKRTVDG